MPVVFQFLLFAVFPLALAYAAAADLLTMTISNKLTLLLAASFVVMAPLTGMDLVTFAMHGAAGGAMLVLTFVMFSMGWIGGGDAKLAAAAALWIGWNQQIIEFIGLASVFGGLLTLVILGFRKITVPAFAMRSAWIQKLHDKETGVPYGIALAAGGLAVYPHTIWIGLVTG